MRLLEIVEDNGVLGLHFSVGGAEGRLAFELPEEWAAWTRAEKVAWAKAQVHEHLQTTTYATRGVMIYPDGAIPEEAKDNFEALPGWATWTADEAVQWIEDNVVDLASAKRALKAVARAIVYLRNITVER